MNINQVNTVSSINTAKSPKEIKEKNTQQVENLTQIKSDTSNAAMAYGLSQVNFGGVQKVQPVQEACKQDGVKTLNLFYFSDTHGELTGLTKLGVAKEACEEYCGGKDHMTVLGSGDLIAGSQAAVINATVGVVNKMGMQATSLGNHERSRSDLSLSQLASKMTPDILAINATESDKKCSVIPSKICKQGDIEFITVGAQPLSPIDDPKNIAIAIDEEVARIKEERRSKGLSDNLPVVFLSHMGSGDDKVVAENSESVDVILGGHTHNVEENNYTNKSGKNVHVLQGGKNNEYATVVKMEVAPDGTVTASSMKINLKTDVEHICSEIGGFYGETEVSAQALGAAKTAEKEIADTVAESVGPKVDIAYVPEGQGYVVYTDGNEKDRERNYSNPVSNIMADAMLEAVADKGVQVSFFNAPSLKDTEIPDNAPISNYDIMGRMLPFGGDLVIAELPIDKFYEIVESRAQSVINGSSQLLQCGGMTYSVDASKAKARYEANISVMKAKDDYQKAEKAGKNSEKERAAWEEAQAYYDGLPGCVEKIMMLQPDGKELKINPKAIKRGDFDGQTIKCVMNDFLAHEAGVDFAKNNAEKTGLELTKVFEKGLEQVKKENDGVISVDHNDVRISIKDKEGIINGYEVPTGLHTKYWYK